MQAQLAAAACQLAHPPLPCCPIRLPAPPPPNSLAIQECAKLLLVAERERGNVQAFEMGTGAHKGALAALLLRGSCRRACAAPALQGAHLLPPAAAAAACSACHVSAMRSAHPALAPHALHHPTPAGTWQLGDRFGHPYALTLGPYGTTLALAWKPGTSPTQAWVVALAAEPGVVAGSWPLQGLQLPHDLTLLPAPLALTGAGACADRGRAGAGWACLCRPQPGGQPGALPCPGRCRAASQRACSCPARAAASTRCNAGERLLSVVVGETRDDGQALHKFILAHAGERCMS